MANTFSLETPQKVHCAVRIGDVLALKMVAPHVWSLIRLDTMLLPIPHTIICKKCNRSNKCIPYSKKNSILIQTNISFKKCVRFFSIKNSTNFLNIFFVFQSMTTPSTLAGIKIILNWNGIGRDRQLQWEELVLTTLAELGRAPLKRCYASVWTM